MANVTIRRFAHALDAAWIIALWKAIHGGDQGPEQIALEAIAALSGTLTAQSVGEVAESSFVELQTRLKEIGVEIQTEAKTAAAAAISTESRIIRTYCVVFKGQRICVQIQLPFFQTHA